MDGLAGMLAVKLTSIISLLPTEAIRRCHFGGCPQGETRLLCWDAFRLLELSSQDFTVGVGGCRAS